MSAPLTGKVALVTGSSSGIGEATARRLAAEGATVVVNSSKSAEAGQAVAAGLEGASYVQADLSQPGAGEALVEEVLAAHGRLDILVNNAGRTVKIPHSDLGAVTRGVWEDILGLNVIGTWDLCVAAVPALRQTGHGCIVNVTSVAGIRPTGSSIPYAVSKAALNHMTLLLANTLGPEIRVNAVAPGLVDTPWTADWELERNYVRAMAPLKASAQPDDIAEVICGVCLAGYMTGEVIAVDGGLHLR